MFSPEDLQPVVVAAFALTTCYTRGRFTRGAYQARSVLSTPSLMRDLWRTWILATNFEPKRVAGHHAVSKENTVLLIPGGDVRS